METVSRQLSFKGSRERRQCLKVDVRRLCVRVCVVTKGDILILSMLVFKAKFLYSSSPQPSKWRI